MAHVLVTGGAGYIGSHTCKALKRAGFTPVVYDNLSTGHAYAVKWGPFVHGELEDYRTLVRTIEHYQPVAVLHFAACALVIESMQRPDKYYRNNVAASLTLFEAMKDTGMQALVFSSSCATYGAPKQERMNEEHPQEPINPYGRTKLMVEQMAQDFEMAYGLKTALLRYFNAAGADLDGEAGEDHTPETHLIPSIIEAALGERAEVVVYGTDFATNDGSAVRDYIHVVDLADAHVRALQHLLEKRISLKLNLGTGVGHSVLQLIRAVEQRVGKKFPVRFEPRRGGEPDRLTADARKAAETLGWKPRHSDVETLVESAWKWHCR